MDSLELGKANLDIMAETLLALAQNDKRILVVTGDSRGSGKLTGFGKALPDQIIEVGIAEQNLVGISAGLASTGKRVFAVSPACFQTSRSLEQIKNDVAYSDQPVKLLGISAGVSYGALGSTHHSLHDYAALLAINNIDIISPADNFETREAIKASVDYPRPVYLRFGKKPMPDLHQPDTKFEIGKAIFIQKGHDITFIATGETVPLAVMAGTLLKDKGISTGVISMHTLRPLDERVLQEAAKSSKAIITVEEHSVNGGLGSLCAAFLMQHRLWLPFKIIAIPDEYTITGSQGEILTHYGISPQGLAGTALTLLQTQNSSVLTSISYT
jgi:transketolase